MAAYIVEAHLPGVFYHRPGPEAEPFVSIGAAVTANDVVGLIELMKSYHEVKAGMPGMVKSFLAENGVEVEPGQGLVVIEDDST